MTALYMPLGQTTCASHEHEELIDLLAAGEGRRAARLMTAHLLACEARLRLDGPEDAAAPDLAAALGPAASGRHQGKARERQQLEKSRAPIWRRRLPPCDLVRLRRPPTDLRWPGGARVALPFVLNFEEGGGVTSSMRMPCAETSSPRSWACTVQGAPPEHGIPLRVRLAGPACGASCAWFPDRAASR